MNKTLIFKRNKWMLLSVLSVVVLLSAAILQVVPTRASVNNPLVGQAIQAGPTSTANIVAEQNNAGGRHIDVVAHWIDFGAAMSDFTTIVNAAAGNNTIAEFTIQPTGSSCIVDINNGTWDSWLTDLGNTLKNTGREVWVRPMQEWNGNWMPWSVGINGTTNSTFISAFRRIVTQIRNTGETNVKFEWNVNLSNSGSNTFMGAYPGDAYTDFVGLDVYNWGQGAGAPDWAVWTSFDDAAWPAYSAISVTGKPVILSEWGGGEPGGSKAQWITDAFNVIRNSGRYNNLDAVIWFDVSGYTPDFQIDTSTSARQAYNAAINFTSDPIGGGGGPTNTPGGPTPTITNTAVPGNNTHSGTWAGKAVLGSSPSYKNFYQQASVATNSTYVLSVWIKGAGQFSLRATNTAWSADLATVTCTATSTWAQCTTPSFNTGSNSALIFHVFDAVGGTAGTLYMDDAFMGVSGGSNGLSNADFESGNTAWTSDDAALFSIVQPGGSAPTDTPAATSTNTPVSPTATRTFTPVPPTATNTAVPGGCGSTNVALNQTATASSIEGTGLEAAKAVDGSTSTRWASGWSGNTQWIYVDLGSTQSVCHVKLNWETAYASGYQVQVSNDASNWTDIYSTTTGNGSIDDLTGLSGAGRYVRVYATVRGTQYMYSLWEFEVYTGSSATPTNTPVPPTPTITNTPANTPTRTNTPANTPTRTSTPTATRTNTPVSSGNTHSGTWAGKAVLGSSPSYKNFYQQASVATNSTYVLSVWIKGAGKFSLRATNTAWSADLATVTCTATSTWTQCTTPSFNTGSNSALIFHVFDAVGGTAGTLYMDDAFMGISNGANRLSNADFESGNTSWSTDNSAIFTIVQP